jgi:toxin ParE1/3/4
VSRRVLFTPAAREQFLAALAYIAADDPAAARSLRDRAAASLSRLADYPESGRLLPEFPDLAFREVIVPPYRFFYRLKDDAVWVVAAWHSAQIPGEPEDVGRDEQADQAGPSKRRGKAGSRRSQRLRGALDRTILGEVS